MMGFNFTNKSQAEIYKREQAALKSLETKERNRDRKKLADRIVNVCIDTTVNEIIRPGPKPEERECYEMANELRALKEQMVTLVTEVLRISDEED
jgi:hypothetical protein